MVSVIGVFFGAQTITVMDLKNKEALRASLFLSLTISAIMQTAPAKTDSPTESECDRRGGFDLHPFPRTWPPPPGPCAAVPS